MEQGVRPLKYTGAQVAMDKFPPKRLKNNDVITHHDFLVLYKFQSRQGIDVTH